MDQWPQRVSITHAVWEEKGMASLPKMSVTNAQRESSERCLLLGEEGGMRCSERVEDKEMDGAGQETEKWNGHEITQMKTSRSG